MNTARKDVSGPIPWDDPHRELSLVGPDDPKLSHVAVVGDTYTILISGKQTAGAYCFSCKEESELHQLKF